MVFTGHISKFHCNGGTTVAAFRLVKSQGRYVKILRINLGVRMGFRFLATCNVVCGSRSTVYSLDGIKKDADQGPLDGPGSLDHVLVGLISRLQLYVIVEGLPPSHFREMPWPTEPVVTCSFVDSCSRATTFFFYCRPIMPHSTNGGWEPPARTSHHISAILTSRFGKGWPIIRNIFDRKFPVWKGMY